MNHCTIYFPVPHSDGINFLKAEAETRFSARTEEVKPVQIYLEKITGTTADASQTIDTHSDDKTYTFLTLLVFWHTLLMPIDRVQKRLQDRKIHFHNVALGIKGMGYHCNDVAVMNQCAHMECCNTQ